MKFRKKPVEVEAMRFDGHNRDEIARWAHGDLPAAANSVVTSPYGDMLAIRTLEGTMCAVTGDWIVKGVKGEFYPVKPDIFALTYEEAK